MSVPYARPTAGEFQVPRAKVVSYLLNLEHEVGGPKARFFLGRGFTPEAWEVFAEALKEHGATRAVVAVEQTAHGEKFVVECALTTPDKRAPCCLSVWIRKEGGPPQFVSGRPGLTRPKRGTPTAPREV